MTPTPVDSKVVSETVVAPKYGGFWIRFVAYLIDGIILAVPQLILNEAGMGGSGFGMLLNGAYFIGMTGARGATVGKQIFKLKVVREDGQPLTYMDAFIRYIGSFVSALVLCIGFIAIGFDARKQGWHDKIAKTLVVKDEPVVSA